MAKQIYTTLGTAPEKIWAVCRVPCWDNLLSTFFLQRGFGEDSDFWAIFRFKKIKGRGLCDEEVSRVE